MKNAQAQVNTRTYNLGNNGPGTSSQSKLMFYPHSITITKQHKVSKTTT